MRILRFAQDDKRAQDDNRLTPQDDNKLVARACLDAKQDPAVSAFIRQIAVQQGMLLDSDAYAGNNSVVVSRLRLLRANPFTYLIAPGVVYFSAYASSTAAFVRSGNRVTARTRNSRPAA